MTTLGSLVVNLGAAGRANGKTSATPLDVASLVASLDPALTAPALGTGAYLLASITAWTNQDDDAHEPCSLTACRHPLHPGPCKGWKGTLHAVSPGTYRQIEEERVRKANERRVKRIADLRSQGKPIPRRLLTEIKPKPAPAHPANNAQAVPLGQVNQKADLAGGQAHTAGQAVSNAAGVQVKTAPPLPLGPKQKKPTVAGRGPAFVITQPKVTDTYKLDKADKITPAEWSALSDADKTTIRNELTAIKARGFGPQQTKADALLAKLPAPSAHRQAAPGKVSLGQATKTVAGHTVTANPAPSTGAPAAPRATPGIADQIKKAQDPAAKLSPAARLFIYRKLDKRQFDSLDDATKRKVLDDLNAPTSSQTTQKVIADVRAKIGVSGTPPAPASTPPAPLPGVAPSAPKALPAHVQAARAVAARTFGGAPTSKKHLAAYGQLSKADFDSLDAPTQKIIRDDLANAKAKFLDPKKKQEAADLLDRFGSRHPVSPAPGGKAPGASSVPAPGGAKGYSDPMNQAMKEVRLGGDRDELLKRVGALSPATIGNLTDDDRKALISRLALTATSRTATPQVKERAAAYQRIIEQGSPAQKTLKLDHEPSLGELHAEETKTGIARAAMAPVVDALKAADSPAMPRADRVKALGALPKAQFDALTADEQRKITDALQDLHGSATADKDAAAAIEKYTGLHPGLHRLKRAEADYRAGKIDADKLMAEFRSARAQSPDKYGDPTSPGKVLAKEAQRVAEDNPSLPLWLRASMIEHEYGAPGGAYYSIAGAQNKYNFEPAPRLSTGDISDIFRATGADLQQAHPIHAEAVKALRQHLIATGLRGDPGVPSGSPWSLATRNHVVDNFLHISHNDSVVPPERMDEFNALPQADQMKVRKALADRILSQGSVHAKTGTDITLRQLQGRPYTGASLDAALVAAKQYMPSGALDAYRRLDPQEFDDLPQFTQDAIKAHLAELQTRAERVGPILTWGPGDNPFRVMPATLADHLTGMRTAYADRDVRAASDISNFGTKIINPYDRVRVYRQVPIGRFRTMSQGDQDLIHADLDKIAGDTANPLQIRYGAQHTKDLILSTPTHFNTPQIVAIKKVDPRPGMESSDRDVVDALGFLDKSDYDKLDKTYREAIDARIAQLPGAQQQAMSAKYHPAAPAASPSGYTPTTGQPNVPPHVQAALDTIYGVHASGKSHTMAHQLSVYGALRGSDFAAFNAQEQGHLLGDLSFIATTAKGPSADKAKKLIDRFTPPGTPSGQVPTGAVIPPANAVPGQVRYATPLKGLFKAKDSGQSGDRWISLPGGGRVWGAHGAAGMMIQHVDPNTGEKRYLMVQRGPAISDPGKWTFPGGASDSKETPHEGATRETIEELGLKDDVFKDALVHGDHTFSVPGSTWKYTTVAVQVPSMIKPNLSTAHARAETSDAKWMTLAEIQALDASGSLHHPIAGGKLETNVLSLFPQGATGQTLGQIARPGPVTKRQGRLHMPPGGRQAPASFNAWPHAHKPSKGKDLIPDKAASDAQRQKIKNDRKLYDGKTADGRLAAIGAQQGFDDTPTVVDRKEIDRLLATGDYIEAWRGVSGAGGGWSARSRGGSGGKTAADINEEMRTGPAYYGKGIFGNGYYLATQKRVAEQYSDHTHGSLVRILIPKTAITKKYDEVSKEAFKNPRTSKVKGGSYDTSTFYDPGRYAAAKGIDGIEIEPHHVSPGGGARHVAAPGRNAFNWLNRSVLILQKEPG